MEIIFSVLLGLGLATACGFRVFVPFLVMSIASLSGNLELGSGFSWIGTYPALIVFGVATLLEILAYYIPYVDNFLDTIATPTAVVCGIVAMSSCILGMSPLMQWTIAIIAGGAVAGTTQVVTSGTRATSTATTGGLGNFLVSTGELIASFFMSVVAVLSPVLIVICLICLVIIFFFLIKNLLKLKNKIQVKIKSKFKKKGAIQ